MDEIEVLERTIRKSDGAFVLKTKGKDGKTTIREFYDDIPNEGKKEPSRGVEISTTIDTHPGCVPVNVDQQRAEAQYQNQFIGLSQRPSTVVPALQPQKERARPPPINRCVPAHTSPGPRELPSQGTYAQQPPRAISDTRHQQRNAERRNLRPQSIPTLPRMSMPKSRGRKR